ncbi:MAG: M18 family aminopeptidase [Polyangiaceae bacterium]|nr:M18 family aminopeptidase [Polyangiaceae bacterium]
MRDHARPDTIARLLAFLDASPSPYHAVASMSSKLMELGYGAIDERDEWALAPGSRHFLVRDAGTLVALAIGQAPPWESGFVMLAAHTDSPGFRLKPRPDLSESGYAQLGVEVYGAPLLYTWLDRELGIAGRVSLRGGATPLVTMPGPMCIIPSLAVHLNREVNSAGLVLDAQRHLTPIWGAGSDGPNVPAALATALSEQQPSRVAPEDILAFDLCLYDAKPATLGGARGEFVCAPRLDNLLGCFVVLEAFSAIGPASPATRVAVFHDHEEIGSQSASGAKSRWLTSVLERVTLALPGATPQAFSRALGRSFLASVDMAQGLHPNYADKLDKKHGPVLGSGPVLKTHASQSYATNAPAMAVFERACHSSGFTPQYFASRNDVVCGTTIGPIAAARLAVRTVDVGNPMLAMHSCRETAGASDVQPLVTALEKLCLEYAPLPPSQ